MGHYHEDEGCGGPDCVKRDYMDTKQISRNPREFLLDGKPQCYDDAKGDAGKD